MIAKLTLILCLWLALPGVLKAQTPNVPAPSEWKRYAVKGEEFSVKLPTLPAMITNKRRSARTKKERQERLISTFASGVSYSISAYGNPKPRQSLEEFIAEDAGDSGQDVTTGRSLTVDGVAGKEFLYPENDQPAIEQFFATNERLYRFAVRGAGADHPAVRAFFASISLGKKTEGIAVSDGPGLPLEKEPPQKVYAGREVDKKVKLTEYPPPDYSPDANSNQPKGVVILKAVFSSTGQVTNIEVVKGVPGLTEKAIEAAKKIKFIPATKDGMFVSMWMQLEYNFN